MEQIYVHGLGQTPNSWEKTIARLNTSASIVCPDLSKMICGKEVTYENLYTSFSDYCNRYEGPLNLYGLSLGGILTLNYAADHPEKVNSLVLIAAQYKMPRLLLSLQNLLFRFMPETAFQQMGFKKKEIICLCKTMAKLDLGNSLGKIKCPTLIICGENDSANRKASKEMAEAIKGARLVTVSKTGHEVNTEAPEQLAGILQDFYKT